MAAEEREEDTVAALEAHLLEQREALQGLIELSADGTDEGDVIEMRQVIEASILEMEGILREHASALAGPSKQDGPEDSGSLGVSHRFRHTDGRWYDGIVEAFEAGQAIVRVSRPIKACMVTAVPVNPGLLKERTSSSSKVDRITAGGRALVLPRRGGLWEAAEVVGLSASTATVVLQDSGARMHLPMDRIAESAFASDDDASTDDDERDPQLLLAREADGATSSDASDLGDSEGEQAAPNASTSEAGGQQTETVTFAGWEDHTRGIASRLMLGMGYHRGSALGRSGEGIIDPVQVQLYRPQAGLGSEGSNLGNAEHTSRRRKRRGGLKARRRKRGEAAFVEREIRRDAQFQAELETGTTGVFALLNKRIGDESEAAKILKKAEQRHSDGLKPSEGSKFEPSERAGTQNTGSSRKTLMTAQDDLAAMRSKVARLRDMGRRNVKDAIIAKQVAVKLAAAEAELGALEKGHQDGMAALQSKEKQKRWLKF